MNKITEFSIKFIELMPKEIEEGILYISLVYSTTCHKCFCGCGVETFAPIGKDGWKQTNINGFVSLSPSLQQRLECQSHYHLTENKVIWL